MSNLIIPTLIVAVMAFAIASVTLIIVLAQKWSTHQIEWKPLVTSDPFLESDKEIEDLDDVDSKTLEEALSLQRGAKKKKKKEDEDPLDTILETNNF